MFGVRICEGDLEDLEGFLRKVWIGVEGSIGPILLKAHDPYSNRGESWRIYEACEMRILGYIPIFGLLFPAWC